MNNHATGMIPLLVFMSLDNYLSHSSSFLIGAGSCAALILVYRLFAKDRSRILMLLPVAATFILYTFLFLFRAEPLLWGNTPLVAELLFVLALAVAGLTRRRVLRLVRQSNRPAYRRAHIRTSLNEFYFLTRLTQGIYTLHLFAVLVCSFLPDTVQEGRFVHFLYREAGVAAGLLILVYEQIRLTLMRGSLRKEMWLPVLDDRNRVVGCIARSVARSLPKKFYHPIVRIVVVYDGMLYLVKRSKSDYISPDTYDFPFSRYVLYRHTVGRTVKEALGDLGNEKEVTPRSLVRYTYEDEKVKHLVCLYAIHLHADDRYKKYKRPSGKLWTARQIQENLRSGIFSSYFEKEFPFLQQTVLYAGQFDGGRSPVS